MIKKKSTLLSGCYELEPDLFLDTRGRFVKTFHKDFFSEMNLPDIFAEEYYSLSHRRVLRGLHFQYPPHEHSKLIYCCFGEILDVAVDLRKKSRTYGEYAMTSLSAEKGNMMFIPEGYAHGFYTLSDTAIIVCKQSAVYDAQSDSCIRWDSLNIPWPDDDPILSFKDKNGQLWQDFISPF